MTHKGDMGNEPHHRQFGNITLCFFQPCYVSIPISRCNLTGANRASACFGKPQRWRNNSRGSSQCKKQFSMSPFKARKNPISRTKKLIRRSYLVETVAAGSLKPSYGHEHIWWFGQQKISSVFLSLFFLFQDSISIHLPN